MLPDQQAGEVPGVGAGARDVRERATELGQKSGLPEEVIQQVVESVTDPGRFADLVAGYGPVKDQGVEAYRARVAGMAFAKSTHFFTDQFKYRIAYAPFRPLLGGAVVAGFTLG